MTKKCPKCLSTSVNTSSCYDCGYVLSSEETEETPMLEKQTKRALKELKDWCEVNNASIEKSEHHVHLLKIVFRDTGDIVYFGQFSSQRSSVIAEKYESF